MIQENDELYSVCSMRIIVDQWLMRDWKADRSVIVENQMIFYMFDFPVDHLR